MKFIEILSIRTICANIIYCVMFNNKKPLTIDLLNYYILNLNVKLMNFHRLYNHLNYYENCI